MDDTETLLRKTGGNVVTMQTWLSCIVIALGAFLFGYNTTALNGPTGDVKKGSLEFHGHALSDTEKEVATSMTLVGAMIAAGLVNFPSEYFGRKITILVNNLPYIAGALLCAFANSFAMLVIGRTITGIGVGIASVVVPQMISEIAPASARGRLTTLNQLLVTIGILVAQVVYFFLQDVTNGWRFALGVAAIPAVLQLVTFFLIPESPFWLMKRGKKNEVEMVLTKLRPNSHDIQTEIDDIYETIQASNTVQQGSLLAYKKISAIAVVCMLVQILTGVNAVFYYSVKIFTLAGIDQQQAATLGLAGLNVIMTIVSLWLIDILGRKPLLLGGMSVMLVSLLASGFALVLGHSQATGYLAMAGVFLFIAGFAIGLGAVLWPILGEIFPNDVRSAGMSLCLATNWAFNLLLSLTVLSLINLIGGHNSQGQADSIHQQHGAGGVFLIFAALDAFGIFFIWYFIPETKGKTLEEIQTLLK